VLVREPDQLGVERPHPQLAFGARLVELAEANRYVAADDDRTPAGSPGLVEERLQWAVKPQCGEPAFARRDLDPVAVGGVRTRPATASVTSLTFRA
jgi:hypothetical protein